jgi:hypothetical protein
MRETMPWEDSLAPAFDAEIAWLRSLSRPIDIAFFPIAIGRTCEPRPSIFKGVQSAVASLSPRVIVPMHVRCRDRLNLYERFATDLAGLLGRNTTVVAPREIGQRFRYSDGKLLPSEP